jgi:thioredoxin-dependent peroxiredoxin
MASTVTMKGKPLALVHETVAVGQKAPDFAAIDNAMNEVRLSQFAGKVVLLSAVPSLDTPVCDRETRRFNQEAVNLGPQVAVLTISMDLPFGQRRWCELAGIKGLITLSDHKDAQFGNAYGLLVKDLRLLARAVYVLDKDLVVRYAEVVPEIANEPNYEKALAAVRALAGG